MNCEPSIQKSVQRVARGRSPASLTRFAAPTMSSLWLRKLALAGATLAPSTLAFSHYTAGSAAQSKPTQSSTALRATPLKQCVGGSWVASSSTATIDVEDPTTGALIGKVPEGTAADAHAALVAAKEAQPAWAKTAPAARGEALKAMARVIRANRVELAELLASEHDARFQPFFSSNLESDAWLHNE